MVWYGAKIYSGITLIFHPWAIYSLKIDRLSLSSLIVFSLEDYLIMAIPLNSDNLAILDLGDSFLAMVPPNKVVNIATLMMVKKLYWQTSPLELKRLFSTDNPLNGIKVEFCNDPMTKCVSSIWEIQGVFYCQSNDLF